MIQSSTAALMLLPASGSKSLLAGIQWLHQIITLRLGKLGQHVGGSTSLQLCASWTSAQSPERRCGLHAYAGRAQTRPEKKKTDLVNLATIIQEVCGRAAIKSRHFAFRACVFTTTVFFLRASVLVVLSGRAAQRASLKGTSAGKATL